MQQDANAAGEFAPYASGRTNVSLSTAEWPYQRRASRRRGRDGDGTRRCRPGCRSRRTSLSLRQTRPAAL